MTSIPRKCGEPDCTRPYQARGFCASHYYAKRRTGELTLLPKKAVVPCAYEGCSDPSQWKEFCSRHYTKVWQTQNKDHVRDYARRYQSNNKDKKAISDAKYRTAHLEEERTRHRDYYQNNKEEVAAKQKKYYQANRETIREQRKNYYERNKDYINDKAREWALANPTRRKEIVKASARRNPEPRIEGYKRRRALKYSASYEFFSDQEVLDTYGDLCHICEFPIDLLAPRKAGAPGWEYGFHVDHVQALARGGVHTLSNVRPAHGLCNLRKGVS